MLFCSVKHDRIAILLSAFVRLLWWIAFVLPCVQSVAFQLLLLTNKALRVLQAMLAPLGQLALLAFLCCSCAAAPAKQLTALRPRTLQELALIAITQRSIIDVNAAGAGFKPISAQQLHAAAAQLYNGSNPAQLADLESALRSHFKAPSFAALGHGPSLLQCCSRDQAMLSLMSTQTATVPLDKV